MILRSNHWLVRLCCKLPLWVPITVNFVRVGWDTRSYTRITWR
jgi:hypothetical protein